MKRSAVYPSCIHLLIRSSTRLHYQLIALLLHVFMLKTNDIEKASFDSRDKWHKKEGERSGLHVILQDYMEIYVQDGMDLLIDSLQQY